MPDLKYNSNDREHVGFADTLGMLQANIALGRVTRDTDHSYYAGHEMPAGSKGQGEYFLKGDCTGAGATAHGRSKNRIIVKMSKDDKLVEGAAWAWRHDNRILKLDAGFFERAQFMRSYLVTAAK